MRVHRTERVEVPEIAGHKRRADLLLLAVGLPVLVVILVVENPTDPFVRVRYPGLIAILGMLFVLLAVRRIPLTLAGIGILVIAGGGVMLRLADLLIVQPGPLADRLLMIVGGHYWSFTVLLALGFLLFDRRTGLRIGTGLWTGSLVLAVIAMQRDAAAGELPTTVVVHLDRVHAFLAIVLAVVAGAAALREQLDRALGRAEVLRTQAISDPLTGLANRTAGNERLDDESSDARRRRWPLAIVLFDIDHFKAINDTHGHLVGDEVLIATAEVISAAVRPRDLLVRWGGEEFLIVLPETTGDEAMEIAERARRALAAARPHGQSVTATFGVAEHLEHEEVKDLLARADAALYEGKGGGRDQVVLAGGRLRDVG